MIRIHAIPHGQQRYETCGDWWFEEDGSLEVRVSETGVPESDILVGIHEAVEAVLCRRAGITQEAVDAFDVEFENTRLEGDSTEPGDSPQAPYHMQHRLADVVERLVALHMGVDWAEHEKRIYALTGEVGL